MPQTYASIKILNVIKKMAREHAILRHNIELFEDALPDDPDRDEYLRNIGSSVDENIKLLDEARNKLHIFQSRM